MHARVHIVVEGLVQGVGYRWFASRRAQALGLAGYVKNLYNGNVELDVEGDRSLIEDFIKEVKVGPRSAQVTNLRLSWEEPSNTYTHFEIRQ